MSGYYLAQVEQQRNAAEDELAKLRAWVREYRIRAEAAEAAVARGRALAAEMRTWCSPHGIADLYADRLDQALDTPTN
ncbi:hypothetical protein [Streptomyces sp. NRRL B-24484]|uniref:hypothetical protein n=1 Tax=Streptomyces sp. NRRL B-24484 TaxID=1463833 RepID=UPI0004BED031|nr:hypothetical protein [Streptomyces sp. NRRL B-24484]